MPGPLLLATACGENAVNSMPACVAPLDKCPDLLTMHALDPARYPFLLESSGGVTTLARYDILFAFPDFRLALQSDWRLRDHRGSGEHDFLAALDELWRRERPESLSGQGLPFAGGWFVFLAYELAQQIEPGLQLVTAPGVPVATAIRIPAAIVHDRKAGAAYAVVENGRRDLLELLRHDATAGPATRPPVPASLTMGSVQEADSAEFLTAVAAARRHIIAGDVYQANISREWSATIASGVEPWMLYERLRAANPAPFSGLALLDGIAIASSSPERLVRVRDGRVETRPIAGTRRREARNTEHDHRRELVGNAKERAEHVMLIDLERNDLGRVCEPGSVQVDEFMVVESYEYVHHIVSNVSGRLRADASPGQVLRAVFPGGTITGCPKVRCMEIISALEARPRGAYTGAMGYLGHDGSCDFNILIRTMLLRGDRLSLSAGSGIVADSVAERELDETRAKAKGMLLALDH